MNAGEVVILSTAVSAVVAYGNVRLSLRTPPVKRGPYAPRKAKAPLLATGELAERMAQHVESDEAQAGNADSYSVTGGKQSVPWRHRRKVLEAAARTKRARRDSFQEEL